MASKIVIISYLELPLCLEIERNLIEKIIEISEVNPVELFGVNDKKLRLIKDQFPTLKLVSRGGNIKAIGSEKDIESFESKLQLLIKHLLKYKELTENNIERLEYKIYPDGRVEQKVIGVKGGDCLKLTEELNNALGEVISSEPTEEMYEQKVEIDQTVTNTNTESSGDSWEGASSW